MMPSGTRMGVKQSGCRTWAFRTHLAALDLGLIVVLVCIGQAGCCQVQEGLAVLQRHDGRLEAGKGL